MLEKYLIEHCSPTLASLKTANLFTYAYDGEAEFQEEYRLWEARFREKGVSLMVLRRRRNTALLYVCRKERLKKDLQQPGVAPFLAACGYPAAEPEAALERLRCRLADNAAFPHEIGVFLGYPLGDVMGFIRSGGRNCRHAGCWKVYCNEAETLRLFEKFKKWQRRISASLESGKECFAAHRSCLT